MKVSEVMAILSALPQDVEVVLEVEDEYGLCVGRITGIAYTGNEVVIS